MEVAKRGGTVHMVCRNKTAADEACEEIKSATGNNVTPNSILVIIVPVKLIIWSLERPRSCPGRVQAQRRHQLRP